MTGPYPDWIYRQSAILPFRQRGKTLEVLLISTRGGKRWTLPKGIVEPGMSPLASAVKESWEEAGVTGPVGEEALGSFHREKWGGRCEVQVFPMAVSDAADSWPEADLRRRQWHSPEKAAVELRPEALRTLVAGLRDGLSKMALSPLSPETPRRIYLLRHAKSSWDDPLLDDHERPLAPRGQRACAAMGRYLRLGDIRPDLVLCSTAARTRETLARVRSDLGAEVAVNYDHAIYLTEAQGHLELLRCQPKALRSLMLVGHNPGLEDLAHLLVGSGDAASRSQMSAKFPTAALAILIHRGKGWRDLKPGSCELHSFVVPRELV